MSIRPHGRPRAPRDRAGIPRRAFSGLAALLALVLAAGCATAPSGPPAPSFGAGPSPGPSGLAAPSGTGGLPVASPSVPPAATPRATPSPAPSPTPEVPATALDLRLGRLRDQFSIPGMSVAIRWDDGRSWLGAIGFADLAAATPVSTGTGFAFASLSKTFTAAVVLQLVEEGRLSLDEPVAPHLPAFALDARITVRMLLDHTSGLPDFFLNREIDPVLLAAKGAIWDAARDWEFVPAGRPVPGTAWAYSNTNYVLLGELVESITGRRIATEIRERLLGPLGLESLWYQAVEASRAPGAVGYRLIAAGEGTPEAVAVSPPSAVMPFKSVVTAAGAAGSIAGTAADAARWIRAFVAGDVLAPETRALMLADADATAALGARVPYGLGIQVTTVYGYRAIGHSGRFAGFRSLARYLPDVGITIAILTNQSTVDPARIAAALAKVVLPPVAPAPSPGASGAPSGGAAASPASTPAASTPPDSVP